MIKKDLKHIDFNRMDKIAKNWSLMNDNDSTLNPNSINRALRTDSSYIEIKGEDDKIYYLYSINSAIQSYPSFVHKRLNAKLGKRYRFQFLIDKKYTIQEVNKILDIKISEFGIDYFGWIEPVIHKYFIDTQRRYYKVYDIYKDIETGHLFIVYKELFGNYEYRTINYSYFLCKFYDSCPFSFSSTYTHRYPSARALEYQLEKGYCCKVKEVVNPKNELYKAYKSIKMAKYKLFGANAYNNFTDDIIRNEIRHYNFLLKVIKCGINKIKEGESK